MSGWLRLKIAALLMIGLTVAFAPAAFADEAGSAKDAHPAAAGHPDAGHGSAGEVSPPIDFERDLALWSLVTFLFFVSILGKFAWAPLKQGLDDRESHIRKEIADAESNRMKAETLLKDYQAQLAKAQDEVKAILAEARRDAEHTKQDILATAQRDAEATRQRTVTDIERAKDAAFAELFDFVSSNVVTATQQVLQRSLTADDQERLVREALSQLNVRRN